MGSKLAIRERLVHLFEFDMCLQSKKLCYLLLIEQNILASLQ